MPHQTNIRTNPFYKNNTNTVAYTCANVDPYSQVRNAAMLQLWRRCERKERRDIGILRHASSRSVYFTDARDEAKRRTKIHLFVRNAER